MVDTESEDGGEIDVNNLGSSSFWVYVFRCARAGPHTLWSRKEDHMLEEEMRSLCDKVIAYRLKKMDASVTDVDTSPLNNNNDNNDNNIAMASKDTVRCFCAMTDIMIDQNPDLYSDLSSKLNTPLQEERAVCKAFTDFAEHLFSRQTTWSLIVSLLTFAGCLAGECSHNGRSVLVKSVCEWTTVFMVLKLRPWIEQNGRLEGLVDFVTPGHTSRTTVVTGGLPADLPDASDLTRMLYGKLLMLYSKVDGMSFDEQIQKIMMFVGILFVVLNVLWVFFTQ